HTRSKRDWSSDVCSSDLFLKAGAGTAAVGFALRGPAALARPARIVGANDRVRVAVIGVHGRGMNHVEGYAQVPNAELAALCDVRSEERRVGKWCVAGGWR